MTAWTSLIGPVQGLHLVDDFFTNEAVADGTVGALDWELADIANAATYAYLVTTNAGVDRYGVLRATTNATANGDGFVIRLDEDNIVLGPSGGFVRAMVRLPAVGTGMNFRLGLQDSVTATEPTVGIWCHCADGVISLQADSADHGDQSAAAQNYAGAAANTLTSGTTLVANTWHEIILEWSGVNAQGGPANARLFIDDFLVAELRGVIAIDDDEEMELSIVGWQTSGGGAARSLDIDFIELYLARGQ